MPNHAVLAVYSCIDFRCISERLVILLASQEACNPDTKTPYAVCTSYYQAHAVVQALPALLAFLPPVGMQASLPKICQQLSHAPTNSLDWHLSLCSHHHVNSIIGFDVGHFQWPKHHAVMAKW